MPINVQRPKEYQLTEADIRYNLQNQLILFVEKEGRRYVVTGRLKPILTGNDMFRLDPLKTMPCA